MARVITLYDQQKFVQEATQLLADFIREKQQDSSAIVTIGLSGGSTPGPIYSSLATEEKIDWKRVQFFLVDERYIPKDNKDASQKLVHDTLLSKVSATLISPNTTTSNNVQEATEDYHHQLQHVKPDLIILGMGPDGHIASLFPPVVEEAFAQDKLAVHTTTKQFAVFDRISVTFTFLLNQNKDCKFVFFMSGKDKKQLWDQMVESKQQTKEFIKQYPASALLDRDTTVFFLLPQ